GSPAGASRAQQIAVAERVLAAQGWGAWPSCSRKVGAKGKATPRTVTTSQQTSASRTTQTQVKPKGPAPAAVPSPTNPSLTKAGANYTVAAGDSLSKIAQTKNIVGGWQAIFQRNHDVLSNPSQLRVGQQLNIG
ncbi:MAG TPA: transglycosylase family protein, partial [Pseudonocardia sp.]|nr:transglycosylase family protein [Pseudonocardia sp.]